MIDSKPAFLISLPILPILPVLPILPILSMLAGVVGLGFIHEKQKKTEALTRAAQMASYELPRLTGAFNFRLNQLREEMLHLYGEQANLARALSEAERERLVFFRREHLGSYAVLVPGGQGARWEVQKYFARAHESEQATQPLLDLFREAMTQVKAPGFWIKRVTVSQVSAALAKSLGSDAYLVAFVNADEGGKPFGLAGLFKASYLFSFCNFFSSSSADALGEMPTSRFVLDEQGKVLCHSQAKFEGTSFYDYAFYKTLTSDAAKAGPIRYVTTSNSNATALVKRVEPGGILFVSEALEVSPWKTIFPVTQLVALAGMVLLMTILSVLLLTRRLRKAPVVEHIDGEKTDAAAELDRPAAASIIKVIKEPVVDVSPDSSEFSKLKRELKELGSALLEIQGAQAFTAGFQKRMADVPPDADLSRIAVDHLAAWNAPVALFEVGEGGISLRASARTAEPIVPFEVKWDGARPKEPDFSACGERIKERLHGAGFRVFPAYWAGELLGAIAIAAESAAHLELVPQLAQIYACALQARKTFRGGEALK